MDKTDKLLLKILIISVLLTVFVVGNYLQTQSRIEERKHAAVSASMVPPSTNQVRTP